jgi:hypothetical protein
MTCRRATGGYVFNLLHQLDGIDAIEWFGMGPHFSVWMFYQSLGL